jgi:dihydroneopterin aldolase/2-amino-4-hydroxy-6-hydroxymethyldihydropteridine diphosphokinase
MNHARDEIRIENLEVFAHHGVYEQETKDGQTFYVNMTLYTDTRKAGKADDLSLSTDYGAVCQFVTKWMQEHTCLLLETVAERMAEAVLTSFPLVDSLDVEIRKPEAPIPLPFGCVSVKIHRGWHDVYLSIGSNLGERKEYLDGAVKALDACPQIQVKKVSSYVETKAYGLTDQPDFLNGALWIRTLLSPEELLCKLHEIEAAAHRERVLRWGPRTLDLDILFYDRMVYESETLMIPHVDLQNRRFVLEPLSEIAPFLRHPILGLSVAEMLKSLPV